MPVTARLSKRFYDTFGDDLANEFVEWFNSVDAQYRADLRDMLDQRFATQDARIDQRFAAQDARIAERFAAQDARIAERLAAQDARMAAGFAAQDARLAGFEARIESQLERLESRLLGRMEGMIAAVRTSQQKWTIGLWTGTMLVVIAARYL
jgi:hypothetical protein